MVTVLELLGAFVLIICGAIGFTNAVEWLGQRMNLGAGAVGALLAAVGTALPESVIPIVALLGDGGEESEQIAIGAIIGAPFLLATLAMLLVVGSSVLWVRRGKDALALGNITGAMTFQATIPVVLGLVFTDWVLEPQAVVAAVIGLAGGALALWAIPRRRRVGLVPVALWGGLFVGYVVYAAATG